MSEETPPPYAMDAMRELLKREVEDKGETIERFGTRAGVDPSGLRKFRDGKTKTLINSTCHRILEALGLPKDRYPPSPSGFDSETIDLSALYPELLSRIAERIAARLALPSMKPLADRWHPRPLDGFDTAHARDAVDRLLGELYSHTKSWKSDWPNYTRESKDEIWQHCRALVADLAVLAVNVGAAASAGERQVYRIDAGAIGRIYVPCEWPFVADFVHAAYFNVPWEIDLVERDDASELRNALSLYLDDEIASGVGADLRDEVTERIWRRDAVVSEIWPRMEALRGPVGAGDAEERYRRVRAFLHNERRQDERVYSLVGEGTPDRLQDPKLCKLVDDLGMGLVIHEQSPCPVLLLDAYQLEDFLRKYMKLLNENLR